MNERDDKAFLSAIYGFVLPFGSVDDPVGLEGLSQFVTTSYEFGTTSHPGPKELFTQIENLGGVFSSQSGRESTYLYCSVPKEQGDKVIPILEEIVKETRIGEKYLEIIRDNHKIYMDEFRSDDVGYASERFKCLALDLRMQHGTVESVDSITKDTVDERLSEMSTKAHFFSLADTKKLEFTDKFPVRKGIDDALITTIGDLTDKVERSLLKPGPNIDLFEHINSDIEQKVVMYGYTTSGSADFEPTLTGVLQSLLAGGLNGVVTKKIREDNSVAYYASFMHSLLSDRGVSTIYAGVSEQNLLKAIELMEEVFAEGEDGIWTEKRLEDAKQYHLGRIERVFESPSSIVSLSLSRAIYGFPPPVYEEEIKKTLKISKNELIEYFRTVRGDAKRVLLINGNLSTPTLSELEKAGYVR